MPYNNTYYYWLYIDVIIVIIIMHVCMHELIDSSMTQKLHINNALHD